MHHPLSYDLLSTVYRLVLIPRFKKKKNCIINYLIVNATKEISQLVNKEEDAEQITKLMMEI